jgi:hypothetical protein
MDNEEFLQANRYRWLRREFLAGRERDIAEGLNTEQELDHYIDKKIEEEFWQKKFGNKS